MSPKALLLTKAGAAAAAPGLAVLMVGVLTAGLIYLAYKVTEEPKTQLQEGDYFG
jgi:hypothetical protein